MRLHERCRRVFSGILASSTSWHLRETTTLPGALSFFLTLLVSLMLGLTLPTVAKNLLPAEHGLINDGYRYRDRHTETFLTRDPAGFIDGPNTYNYVRHNPWSAFDPNGLATSLQVPTGTQDIGYSGPPSSISTNPDAGLSPNSCGIISSGGFEPLSELLPSIKAFEEWVSFFSQPPPPLTADELKKPDLLVHGPKPVNDNSAGSRATDVLDGIFNLPGHLGVGAFNLVMVTDVTSAPLEFNGWSRGVSIGEERALAERLAGLILLAVPEFRMEGYLLGTAERELPIVVRAGKSVTDDGLLIGLGIDDFVAKGGAGKSLLPGEGAVGTYDDLIAAGSKGDNITPHHIPAANHMSQHGVSKGEGIAINMEQPFPGSGGRHRATFTYGTQADLNLTPREALGQGIWDARRIYQQDGLYGSRIRSSLQDVIRQNRSANPNLFSK